MQADKRKAAARLQKRIVAIAMRVEASETQQRIEGATDGCKPAEGDKARRQKRIAAIVMQLNAAER